MEKEHKKETLMNRRKEDLVNYIMCLEHNNNVLFDTINQQAENFKALLPTWIPVSERLPESEVDVLVTYENGKVSYDFIGTDGDWFWEDREEDIVVLAWMPLPEPYKEE